MTIEERLDQLEKRNKRLTAALTLMAVAICAVVTVAATDDNIGRFDAVFADRIYAKTNITAKWVFVTNNAGDSVLGLGADDGGNALVDMRSAKGEKLVTLGATDNGGFIEVINKTGEGIAQMFADEYGNGVVWAGNRKGKGRTLTPEP